MVFDISKKFLIFEKNPDRAGKEKVIFTGR